MNSELARRIVFTIGALLNPQACGSHIPVTAMWTRGPGRGAGWPVDFFDRGVTLRTVIGAVYLTALAPCYPIKSVVVRR
jgi:hypothetical protein